MMLARLTAAIALFVAVLPPSVHAVTISISCGAVGAELQACREGIDAWSAKTGNEVRLVSTPNSSTERLALYLQILAARGTDIDVYQIDVVWPGILAQHMIDLGPYAENVSEHFPVLVENNTFESELKAVPWFTDAGLLYYRRDLLDKYKLAPPATWEELTDAAQTVMEGERATGRRQMWGYVFQARAYEGLTCNALEWIDGFGGGQIVEPDGTITVDNENAVAALKLAGSWIGTITPQGVLNYTEEEARGVFQSGNAVFMRNWPYAWSLSQSAESPVKGVVGVAALPKGGRNGHVTGTLGGWQLAVSRYSAHPEVAADLVRFLTSREEQKRRAVAYAYNPTIATLYEDPEVLAAAPFMGELYETFANAVARPSQPTGQDYNRVSYTFWTAVHNTLTKRLTADEALAGLADDLERMKLRGW